MDKDVGGYG